MSSADEQLKTITNEIRSITPNIGQKRLVGALRSRGLRIQRRRVRACLREVDPLGTALRGGLLYTGENTQSQRQTLCGTLMATINLLDTG